MTMYGNERSARNCHICIHREHWDAVKYCRISLFDNGIGISH